MGIQEIGAMMATVHRATETVVREIEETDTITRICMTTVSHKTTRITVTSTTTGDTGMNTRPTDRDTTEGVEVDHGVLQQMRESLQIQLFLKDSPSVHHLQRFVPHRHKYEASPYAVVTLALNRHCYPTTFAKQDVFCGLDMLLLGLDVANFAANAKRLSCAKVC